jgi:hypothetical protein
MSGSPFSRTALWVIVPVAAVSLLVTIVLTLFGDEIGGRPSAAADAYSRSAIGHRGLVEILRKLDVPVEVSRGDSAAKAKDGVLVIAEPVLDGGDAAIARLRDEIKAAPRTLVVLPKWYGLADRDAAWIEEAELLPESDVRAVLDAIGVQAQLRRYVQPRPWESEHPDLPLPTVKAPQAIDAETTESMIYSGRDTLLGRFLVDGNEVWILADPDVIDNAGLRVHPNAQLAVAILDRLRRGGPVVFDEATHGYAEMPSLWHALFRFPLVLATLQGLMCALLVAWAAMVRFGPRRAAPPPIAPGKDFLIRNTAALLRYGGHHGHALRRYLAAAVLHVRHALHAPELAPAAATAWLERVRKTRGGTISLPELEATIDAVPARPPPHQVLELAELVHRWRMEMTHGSDHHP